MKYFGDIYKVDGRIKMISDPYCNFGKFLGIDIDLMDLGLGIRSNRFSMIVDDGVVKSFNVEKIFSDFAVTGPIRLLDQLDSL